MANFKYLVLLFVANSAVFSQDVAITNFVATNITASKNDILEIDFKDHPQNQLFLLAWVDDNGQEFALRLVTTKHKLIFPIADQKGWKGNIRILGLSIHDIDVQLRKATLKDYWTQFMLPTPMTPGSINFTNAYSLYGISFRWVCLFLMIVLTAILFIQFKNIHLSLLLGFTISFIIYDARNTKNRWDIIEYYSEQNYKVDIFTDLDIFLTNSRDYIGDKIWTKEQLSGVLNPYCLYQLADLKYAPPKSELIEKVDFIITSTPKNRNVIYSHGPYFLLSNKQL